jgi:nitrate reductase / nitrite oxidoreductase, beta subunit
VPDPYLVQMFGAEAPRAAEMYRTTMRGEDTELRGLLLLFGSTDRVISRFEVRGGKAMGYDRDGQLLSEVPLQEPAVVRSAVDAERETFRTNIT